MKELKYRTSGLTCANCSAKIEDILNKTGLFEKVTINALTEEITIKKKDSSESEALTELEKNLLLKTFEREEAGSKILFDRNLNEKKTNRRNSDIRLEVKGLTCANCSAKIEDELQKSGVFEKISVSPINQNITVYNRESLSDEEIRLIQKTVDRYESGLKVEYNISKKDINNQIDTLDQENENSNSSLRIKIIRTILAVILFAISLLFKGPVEYLILLTAYFLAGYEVVLRAIKNILKGKVFDENFLMTVASFGALYLGEFREAAAVMIFYCLGELLQDLAVEKSKKNIEELLDITAEYANILTDDGEKKIKPEEIVVNDILVVRAGEKIPVDGLILEGKTSLDMKAINGESLPREFEEGDEIVSGSLNLTGTIKMRAEKKFEDSTVGRIMDLVRNSSSNKAETERFITKFSKIYTPIVVILALITAFVVPLITGQEVNIWMHRALNFLVISCPCALVLSIPLGFFGGIGLSSKHGILVKGANYLDNLRLTDTFVFDKTGTLTTGQLSVEKIKAEVGNENELISEILSLEKESPHPIAKSLVRYALEKNISEKYSPISNKELPGKGLEGTFRDHVLYLGNYKLMKDIGIEEKEREGTILHAAIKKQDGIVVYLGYVKFSDSIKNEAAESLKKLKDLGVKNLIMLTGDNAFSAEKIADQAGITEYKTDMLPQDKLEFVKGLISDRNNIPRENRKLVAFVGDGLNDTPVLGASDIGISMGDVGSDAAVESSDIVITDDNLRKIPMALKISKETYKIVMQNIVLSLGIKIAVLILAFFGLTNIYLSIFADVGVALLAVINAGRLIFKKID